MASPIEHVIVLMLENRSFDHMLGFLDHPNPAFPRLEGTESNIWEPGSPPKTVSPDARHTISLDPSHAHVDVMVQLTGQANPSKPYEVTNSGFAYNYELLGLGKTKKHGFGPEIMRCHAPESVPVLATLAKSFAVCTQWFASVPGETWPNRNFAHAGTSDGEVNITKRLYHNRTVFEVLADARHKSVIYHDGMCQVLVFKKLIVHPRVKFEPIRKLLSAIAANTLPSYAFVEPDHFGGDSGSQHPNNNVKNGDDFKRAEQLIADIYRQLAEHAAVFDKTLLVITYDEHGGFFDREAPPFDEKYKDGCVAAEGKFAFDLLGVRVPAVLVSPRIPAGTIDDTIYDHSSIPATLRALFAPTSDPLGRGRVASTFHHHVAGEVVRTADDMPQLPAPAGRSRALLPPSSDVSMRLDELDEFQGSLVWLTAKIEAELENDGIMQAPLTPPRARGVVPLLDNVDPVAADRETRRQQRVVEAVHQLSEQKDDA